MGYVKYFRAVRALTVWRMWEEFLQRAMLAVARKKRENETFSLSVHYIQLVLSHFPNEHHLCFSLFLHADWRPNTSCWRLAEFVRSWGILSDSLLLGITFAEMKIWYEFVFFQTFHSVLLSCCRYFGSRPAELSVTADQQHSVLSSQHTCNDTEQHEPSMVEKKETK